MIKERVFVGFKFTDAVYTDHIITGYNGNIIYTYDYDLNGCVSDMAYNKGEIADLMREYGDKTHRLVWEQPQNVSLTHDGFDIDIDADEDGDVFSVFVKPTSSAWWDDVVDFDTLEEALDFIQEAKRRGEE